MLRLFQRTINKAEIDIKYSQGFNPHPRISIASPLSLGIESMEEYMDIELNTEIPVEEFIERMNRALPNGIDILRGKYIDTKKSVAAMISWAFYEISFKTGAALSREEVNSKIKDYLAREEISILKKRRKKRRKIETEVDIRPLIGNLKLKEVDKNKIILEALLKTGGDGNLKPIELVKSINLEEEIGVDLESVNIKRIHLYAEENGEIYKPV